jgi:hypothetical protein
MNGIVVNFKQNNAKNQGKSMGLPYLQRTE